jgi:hypothetical protein
MTPLFRHARSLLVLVPLLAGCHASFGSYRVPSGVRGTLPDTVGDECRVRSGETVIRIEDLRGFATLGPGEAHVRCSKYDVTFFVEELGTLQIDGPSALGDGEFTLKAVGKSGAELDLSLMRSDGIAWTWPDFMRLNYPSCGHMAPICSGSLGNGTRMKGYVLNQKTGEGFITVRLGAFEAKHTVKGVLREP